MDSLPAERRDVERSVASLHDSDHRLVEHDFRDFDPPRQQRYQLEPRVHVARLDERLVRDVGIVGHLHSRHVGQDSPAETHLDVVGVNLAPERAADLVEHGLAALRDDRVQVGRGIEQDRAGENHDGSDNCGGDYDDSTHTRTLTSATRSGSRHAASVVDARRMRSTLRDERVAQFEPRRVGSIVCR